MILENCRLIGALSDGIQSERADVRIKDGKFAEICAQGGLKNENEERLDCGGKTLLPGLIDAHTHVACLRDYSESELKDPMGFLITACNHTKRYLEYGFTAIRDCGTPLRVANYVRDAFACGLCEGPEVIAPGLILSPTEVEEKDSIYEMYSWTDSADEARKAARKELAEHADFIKVMASGSALHKQGVPDEPIMRREELEAIVEAARVKGSYVAAHAHGDSAVRLCAQAGVRTIEHASYIGTRTIEAVKRQKDCYLIPTVSAFYQNPEMTTEKYQYLVKKLQEMLDRSKDCIRAAYEAGVPMGFGTDSTCGMDQYEEGIEFRYRSELCGMSNLDILLQATKNNAKALGIEDRTGQIKKGLQADCILVDGDPTKDLSIMYCRPDMVFLRGKRVV